jgi:lipopolysaccharide transport system permease protein
MPVGSKEWVLKIRPEKSLISLDFKALWRYRDLLSLFVKRDFVSLYKQTILGPIWVLLQPLLTTATFIIIFEKFAKISTNGLPGILFYMSGIVLWSYYSDCLSKTSETFTSNENIFGKVYFPRLIVPLSIVVSNLVRFGIQLLLLVFIWFYFDLKGVPLHFHSALFLFPVLVLLMGGHGLALGIIISSLTTKYRDLKFLVQFGIQLLMYASPVVYPLSSVPDKYKWIMLLNPMTSIIETFKYGFLGIGEYRPDFLWINFLSLILISFIGLVLFSKTEKNFMDTV